MTLYFIHRGQCRKGKQMTFEGKVALLTGSGRGIAKEAALQMAAQGAAIVLNDIVEERLRQAEADVKATGADVLAVNADVTKPQQVQEMVARAVHIFGSVDILVNSAGGSLQTPRFLEEISEEDWARVVDFNLGSQFRCTKAVVPFMKKKGWGRIVNIASSAGTHGEPLAWSPAYSAAKAGVLGFTRQIAIELGRHGITCNAISQGDTETERSHELWAEGLWPETEEEIRERYKHHPIPRMARPAEVAAVITFLCSSEASYINAENIMVTGGAFISP
ncbi:MAG TPA: hypothetical protein DEP84_02830 [Chloroflexi bacterium]|nr:hypothetical protein [Chloroflexota bacterium]